MKLFQVYWNGSSTPGAITFEIAEPDTVSILVVYAEDCNIEDFAVVVFDSCVNKINSSYYNSQVKIIPNPSANIFQLNKLYRKYKG